ncbi:biopolymer transport ExbD protein [Flavobacterium cauense R2A-7]|uniref:Biopolymer transport protein ExbD n=1 Tax=Flavobacterium cauense R2A-7 TaxID=1341154 RepID=V6S4D9_9FLAO|nr:biopolymer transporter ExbD [Flavobacterium cauense]ESU21568.1 biopolymer transport ExbD protein [Flavobacterium cauense R2A-7]KGO80184.1 biopolymer transporter ExbD [Flavobacterium cauense R2A-7]TWI10497.1 biopolymer transport protein ExbD [Flavobacterium cauense R2A-7]
MAELNSGDGGGGKKKGHVRSKKQNAGVDLTAMVDLAFLLITFFMLTTSLSKPQSMNLAMPDKEDKPKDQQEQLDVADDRSMTLLLGEKNQIVWYYGLPDNPIEGPTKVGYGKNGIRKELLAKEKTVLAKYGDPKKGLIVLIKASKKSTYRNLVDVLDEMAIAKVPTYAIVDITPEENAMLEKEGLFTK